MAIIQYAKPIVIRDESELVPALRGLEGARVEVVADDGSKRRFWVGKSTGWRPCHLEIARIDSTGGAQVWCDFGNNVRVVRNDRRY